MTRETELLLHELIVELLRELRALRKARERDEWEQRQWDALPRGYPRPRRWRR